METWQPSPDTVRDGPSAALATHRDEVIAILNEVGGQNVRVFGSVARGDDTKASDIDLLADFSPNVGIFSITGAWNRLRDLLGFDVDLIPADGLKPRMAHVLSEAVVL